MKMSEETVQDNQAKANESTEKRPSAFESALKKLPLDLIPLIVLFATVCLVILFANDWKLWDGQRAVEETNDAYVRADVTPLSTKVSGTVSRVFINDYDRVKKGQLIAELRNDDFAARELQAKSSYYQALADVEAIKSQIHVQADRIENSRLTVGVSKEEVTRSTASVGSTSATLNSAVDAVNATKAEKSQAEAKLEADQAIELRALQERNRQQELFKDDASTQQTIEQVVADYNRASATVLADRAQINQLAALIKARESDVIRQAEELKSANAGDSQSVLNVAARNADLSAERHQLDVLQQRLKQSEAEAQASLANWENAKVDLDYTMIRAPIDGVLSDRRVRAGQQVNAGTQVVTIVSAVPWVIASYRETQLRKIEVGDRAEVSVDALGGAVLKGKVQSLSPASEAQFALLPPDNPSGNFTKITQRVPIKIVFNENQKNLDRIKSGMTVIAKIWTH